MCFCSVCCTKAHPPYCVLLEKDVTSSLVLQAPQIGTNPFDGVKSEDEEEEEAVPDRGGEEEEVSTFLEGDLADRLPFLQQRSRQGIAMDDQEPDAFGIAPTRAEEALRTCEFSFSKRIL